MWLVVGLGNPGPRYDGTVHNFGFAVVDELARRAKGNWSASNKVKAEVCDVELGGEKATLMKPLTFMNISGEAVGPHMRYYKINPAHVLAISDDVAIPWGRLRIRDGGSHGGHNGLRSLIDHLATDRFPRLRIGCEPDGWKGDLASYVLAKLGGEPKQLHDHMVAIAADAVEAICAHGVGKAQNKFNAYKV